MNPAEEIAAALDSPRREGAGWRCLCPAHDDHNPSLDIIERDGKILFICRAGCSQKAVIAALRARDLWPKSNGASPHRGGRLPETRYKIRADVHQNARPAMDQSDVANAGYGEVARRIWRDAKPAAGTTVERYLKLRGITAPPPPSIRFAIGRHAPSQRGPWAIMVAAVQNCAGEIVAVHRTFLTGDGRKAPVEPVKMALGQIRGCAIRFAKAGERLAIAEGIETTLSVAQACPDLSTWCAISASNLPLIELPAVVREVIICADADEPGEKAAHETAQRFLREGRKVRIARPEAGLDFNDHLRRERA